MSTSDELLTALSAPFDPADITWKPGATTKDKGKALGLAYADLRAYQDRLDSLLGLDWAVSYAPWGDNRIVCTLTLYPEGQPAVSRSSTGEVTSESLRAEIAGTVAEAQAFKRAAAMFGLGRYLYHLPQVWAEFDGRRFTPSGEAALRRAYDQAMKGSTTPAAARVAPDMTPVTEAPEAPEAPAAPEAPSPDYPADMPDMATTLAKWARNVNGQPGNLASDKQVEFLSKRLWFVGGKSLPGAAILEELLGGPVPVKAALASKLLDSLAEFSKNETTGKWDEPNPKYNAQVEIAVRDLATWMASKGG